MTAWAPRLESGLPENQTAARRELEHRHRAPDPAGVREPAAVAELPEGERPAWRRLWADVAALLKKAPASK
jgi:hypothetical protein